LGGHFCSLRITRADGEKNCKNVVERKSRFGKLESQEGPGCTLKLKGFFQRARGKTQVDFGKADSGISHALPRVLGVSLVDGVGEELISLRGGK